MKTVKHTSKITTELITSESGANCYEVVKKFDNENANGGKGLFICLYPTKNKDNMHFDDSTLLYLQEHSYKDFNFSEIHIVNIFSKVVSARLSARGLVPDKDNLAYIASVFKRKDFDEYTTVISWGGSYESCAAANESKTTILKTFKEIHPNKKLYQMMCPEMELFTEAMHPLFAGLRCRGRKLSLVEYSGDKYLKQEKGALKVV